ncbi:MAG TPA: RIP metalloprotease RseP [Candidatus Acidoferrales bacterium]|nr:RIP metalloprotease RseP [Candidatus Acidoferrales bacterium]
MLQNALFDLTVGALVLGLMVLLHEYGHFVAAKMCGVRVDIFSIGFGPRIWGVKRGDTDYRISVLPLGGYVKMAGDNPIEERTGEPYEFLSRPRWQRFIIAVAGPAANIILCFLLLFGALFFIGMPYPVYTRQPAIVAGVASNGHSGLQRGDRIVAVNGHNTPTWDAVDAQIAGIKPNSTLSLTVMRGGSKVDLSESVGESPVRADSLVGYPAQDPLLGPVQAGYPAEKAGLKAGDRVVSLDGRPVNTFFELPDLINASDGHPLHFVVERDGKQLPITVTPQHTLNPETDEMAWMIGIQAPALKEGIDHESLFAAVRDGYQATIGDAVMMGEVVSGLVRGELSFRDLAGPVGIVQLSGQYAKRGPLMLLQWMAYISLDLALINLLPIPILDGGHVLMLAIEGTLRRDLSLATKERFVQVGLVFILGIFAFVMYSDILRLFQH